MAYSKVLNRPMFNKHNSAYGRGIASNLVTEEQRVRYNAGGRVGLAEGSWGWDKIKNMFGRGGVKGSGFTMSPSYTGTTLPATISKTPKFSERALWEAAKKWGPKAGGAIASGLKRFPLLATGAAAAYVTDPEDWEEEMDISRWDKIKRDLTPWAGTKKKIEQYQEWKKKQPKEAEAAEKGDWEKRLTAKAEIDDPTGEEMETATLDVADWTPKEKEEKERDVALAMAERLIGGSRDKWGSTAQMKNLAGALGDVRKITDKEDIRKDQRKYRAYAEAQKDIAKSLATPKNYRSFQAEGARPSDALYRAEGIHSKTIEKMKDTKRGKEYAKANVGDVIFDENDTQWKIKTPDGFITVSVEELIAANKRGDIAEMKKTVTEGDSGSDQRSGRG